MSVSTISPKLQKQLDRLVASGDKTALHEVTCEVKRILDERELIRKAGKKGRTARSSRGSKRKGSVAVHEVRAFLLDALQRIDASTSVALSEDDILIQTTSVGGNDLHLSPLAQDLFPFGIEVKNKESLNVYQALAQAARSASKKGLFPILFFKKNGWPLHVAFDARLFRRYLRGERPREGDCSPQKEREDHVGV